ALADLWTVTGTLVSLRGRVGGAGPAPGRPAHAGVSRYRRPSDRVLGRDPRRHPAGPRQYAADRRAIRLSLGRQPRGGNRGRRLGRPNRAEAPRPAAAFTRDRRPR